MRRIRTLLSASTVLAALTTLGASALAAVPGTLTHQGRLYDEQGAPITDSLDVTFSIYDGPVASAPV